MLESWRNGNSDAATEIKGSEKPVENLVTVESLFTDQSKDPFDSVEWEQRDAEIKNPQTGEKVFSANGLEFPKSWSQNCVSLVADKYFRHVEQEDGSLVKETSVRQMISRVADQIANWGIKLDYFPHHPVANGSTKWPVSAPARTFRNELCHILVNQMAAFNSPVWFNVGTKMGRMQEEQCSACFINSLEDTMGSILQLSVTEGKLYKGGSGSGVNYSALRSSREGLSNGGYASGPVPFIAKDDFNAGAIKSGGGTRRAAKMASLDADHGDIFEFVNCKHHSEKAAQALVDAGFSGDFRARWGAYQMVPFQNANHSVRVTDEFMEAVENDGPWNLMSRDGKEVLEVIQARALWKDICASAHFCGDPGLQFDTTINKWHTSPASGRINGSNPCSEFMYLDDTACNLASINLVKFIKEDGSFDIESYQHTIDVLITAMDILVDAAGYPTDQIAKNSHKYRPLGLGFTNLGGYLMAKGLPYDSDEARSQAGLLTAILTGRAYARSAELAKVKGPFEGYTNNATAMVSVMKMHRGEAHNHRTRVTADQNLADWAIEAWDRAIGLGNAHGYRNSQASVIAPAGTISFLMDADTTGIEPELALAKVKKLVGGGTITIMNTRVRDALGKLGYHDNDIEKISKYVVENGSLVGSGVTDQDLPVFDTSFADPIGGRSIRPEAHLLMMAAVQPFVSGAISKTCNMPSDATEEDISEIYRLAWKTGLKAVAIYRDGSKRTQPLESRDKKGTEVESQVAPEPLELRRKLPNDCLANRHKFSIGGHKGYIHVGLYPDGRPGEVFIKMAKEGSTVAGLMDTVGVLTSFCLQYGVPLSMMVDKLSYMNFAPQGMTNHQAIRFAKSPTDYLFRYLEAEYLRASDEAAVLAIEAGSPEVEKAAIVASDQQGLICAHCGNPAQRSGSCTTCMTCGTTSGCG